MLRALSKFIFKIIGWKITGNYPHHIKKKLLIAVPHTSFTDFFIGILARKIVNGDIQFVAKHTLFWEPLGTIMRCLGGVAVNRSTKSNFVEEIAKVYRERQAFTIILAPEGTRKKVEKFRTGFYFIAKEAGVPIIPIKFDYEHKLVDFGAPYYVTGDIEKDISFLENYFKGTKGRFPELSF